jgi:cytochrome c-type biogenesis protein CcmF
MIPELGHFALIIAFAIAIVQSVVPLIGAAKNDAALISIARPAALAQFLFIGLAYAALTHAFIVHDFSVYICLATLKPGATADVPYFRCLGIT